MLLVQFCLVLCIIHNTFGNDNIKLMNRFLEATPIHPQIRTPDVWLPESNTRIKFTTNEYYPTGFAANSDCGEIKKNLKLGDYGTITSPKYPRNYPGRKSCEWVLEGPPGSRIQTILLDLVTQPFSILYTDFIMIARSGNFSLIDRLSGDMSPKLPMIITSDENKFGLRFRSNLLSNFRGFKLQYLVIPDEDEKFVTINHLKTTLNTPVFDGICGQSYSDFPSPTPNEESPSVETDNHEISPSIESSNNEFPIIKPPNKKFAPVYNQGGIDILKYAYPWMVAILIDNKHFCGGSLIDDQHILTAAHCTYRTQNLSVMIGSYKLKAVEGENDGRLLFNIPRRNVFQHPEYNPNTLTYDISIIRLPEKITFNDRIRPVCLPNRNYITQLFTDESTYVSGWGLHDDNAVRAGSYLKEADVKVIPNSQCQIAFRGVVNGNTICTSTKEYSSPCKGDSGGPLMTKHESSLGPYYMQIGIVSFGSMTCENGLPFGYTRITAFLDYITEITGKTF